MHRHGSVSPVFGGHFAGGVEDSGRQWWRCAAKAGFGPVSHRHGLGDGAPWIVNQFDHHFGTQGRYLIDFFHVCDYLSAAAPVCAADHAQAWLDVRKERLKANQVATILDALEPFIPADQEDDPVTAGDRYLRNRLYYLDYQGEIQQDLPIGSGEIESAHRIYYPATTQTPQGLVVTGTCRSDVGLAIKPRQPRMGGLLATGRKTSGRDRSAHRCITLNRTRMGLTTHQFAPNHGFRAFRQGCCNGKSNS